LTSVATVFEHYFGGINEERLKDNYVLAYQLLDELNDGGNPFNNELNILEEMIQLPTLLQKSKNIVLGESKNISSILPNGTLSQTPWRRKGVKYTANEIFIDIIEEIDAIVEPNGTVVSPRIAGFLQVECKLSGDPDLVLRLKNPGIINDISLHKCVRLQRYQREGVISFVPPDGIFKLIDFKCEGNVPIPITITSDINFSEGQGTIRIELVNKKLTDEKIEKIRLRMPLFKQVINTSITSAHGDVMMDENDKVLTWTLDSYPKDTKPVLEGSISFPLDAVPIRPDVYLDFELMLWSASGLGIESLTLLNEDYNHFKGVRTIVRGGKLRFRT
jgi:AP-3 complex subunit mu